MRPKIYITRKLPAEIVDYLSTDCTVSMWEEEDEPVPQAILEKEIEDADGLLCLLTEKIDANLLSKAHKLKVVSNLAVGYNNIDIPAANAKGILVTNTPGALRKRLLI
ncbi:hypothetical protein [Aneurinibacillus tyrosinisolvens]|uniref:hypothetical protein n=1 Tax=Aneurinibacillus tyrosinisolvens TaxID=1443435 RepID=UPI000AFBAFCF